MEKDLRNRLETIKNRWENELVFLYGGELEFDFVDGEYRACAFHNEPKGGYDSWIEVIKELDGVGITGVPDMCKDLGIAMCVDIGVGMEDEMYPIVKTAETLPDGYKWTMYSDGSGSLKAPDGTRYFSYDKAPYANVGWIEYQAEKGSGWSVFEDSFSEFMKFAEEYVAKNILKETEIDTVER